MVNCVATLKSNTTNDNIDDGNDNAINDASFKSVGDYVGIED